LVFTPNSELITPNNRGLMVSPQIVILGIGNILYSDEGFGVRVIERLQELYTFSDNVSIIDGGVLGMNLLGVISQADYLIVVDAVRNGGTPGTLVRLRGAEIPARIRAKNSLHQVDFLEALTMCQALDKVPQTVILGVEPQDIGTLSTELTPLIQTQVDPMTDRVLLEIARWGASYRQRSTDHVPGCTFQDC
jgi:hydrogenase maturation protease